MQNLNKPIVFRRGNKQRLAKLIVPHFPPHSFFIDMFFGAGGLFFEKPLARFNVCNDSDSDVINLYNILLNRKEELYNELFRLPIDENLFLYWREHREDDPMRKAVRFVLLSNFSFLASMKTFKLDCEHTKTNVLDRIWNFRLSGLANVRFVSDDFRVLLNRIRPRNLNENAFIYADPPYCGTKSNYSQFKESDTRDLFDVLKGSGVKFAISEFSSDFILGLADEFGLRVVEIGERVNLKDRRTEILIKNY